MTNIRSFILFLIIALLIYTAFNLYLYSRIISASALSGRSAMELKLLLLLCYLAYPIGMIFGKKGILGSVGYWFGSFWFGVLAYGVMIALLMDILTLSHHLLHWLPGAVLENKIFVGRLLLISSSALVIITLVTGFINSRNPQVRRIIIETPKLNNEKDYHLAIFADTHLGLIVGKEQLRQIALKVNNLKPDAILIVGDLVDEAPEGLLWAIDLLSSLQAPDGVWMVTGNHEFYYGIGSLTLITAPANIGLLRNEVQKLGESLALIGLEDATGGRQFGIEMPSISDLIKQTDTNLPTVLLHHSPLRIQEAAKAGVDIMVSGHTHAGQLWPVGYIADAVYGVKTGLSDIQGMKFYLTTGAGTWGPPARVGNRPEILELVIRGK